MLTEHWAEADMTLKFEADLHFKFSEDLQTVIFTDSTRTMLRLPQRRSGWHLLEIK